VRVDRDAFERVKPKILERDHHTCRKCLRTPAGDGIKLEVHHLDLDGSNHTPDNLITLCSFCHKALEAHHRHQRKYSNT
jgi:5-methylcytosine-specific restriction endonuclease McrA